jgi:uncharacterized protein
MQMNDQKELPVGKEIAWQALNDITLLKMCIPGCESIQANEDGSYEVLIHAAVGPVKAKFKGLMRMKDVLPPDSYTLEFNGQGGAVGYGRGQAQIALVEVRPGTTMLSYAATANVGGKLAQVGARLIDMAAQKMATDFFDAFLVELSKRHGPVEQQATMEATGDTADSARPAGQRRAAGVWTRLCAWIAGLFGRHQP